MDTNNTNTANTAATATGTAKKRFLPAEVGLDAKGKPHAFHVEGYVGNPPYFTPADGDEKKAYLGFSLGIGQEADRLYALATGTYNADTEYGGGTFIKVKAFGKIAEEFSQTCDKGLRVAVSGTVEKETFKNKKTGEDGENVVILAANIVIMGSKSVEAILNDSISVATRVFTGKDGVERSQPMAEGLCGTVKQSWGLKESNGKTYLSLSVRANMPAEKVFDLVTGKYSKDKEYKDNMRQMNVTLFGKQATALAGILRTGAEVVMTGPVNDREYNGEISYQMLPRIISIMKFASKDSADAAAATSAPAGSAAAAMEAPAENAGFAAYEDDDGELPF